MTPSLPRYGRSVCSSCSRPILWVRTENDRAMPIDPQPTQRGNLELDQSDPGGARVRVVKKGERRPPELYISHFATCPNAKRHRRRGP